MAHAPAYPAETQMDRGALVRPTVEGPPVTPGKVAIWLFLATEVMFFTGLIGSYVVLRAGSPATAYPNIYPPATDVSRLADTVGVPITEPGPDPEHVSELLLPYFLPYSPDLTTHDVEHMLRSGHAITPGMPRAEAEQLAATLHAAGATVPADQEGRPEFEPLRTYAWPQPYDSHTNPLSIDLTALNTFILICSSVTMVLALSAIQRGDKKGLTLFLLATVLIGSVFLGIQVYEYTQLMLGHIYPPGISATGHFRPSVSLFASCFFVMTGFHGAHVAGGVVLLTWILIQSLFGTYTPRRHSPVELAGLYWHFVDLVWIILFTVVYLV